MNNVISIVCSAIIFLFPYLGRKWFSRQLLSSTVVSLGLLGTFGGIMFGLWEFGVERIDQSIPQLLEGLKTAFLTSIAGMLSSLLLRLYPAFYGIREKEADPENSPETTLLQLLGDIKENTRPDNHLLAEIKHLREESNLSLTATNELLTLFMKQGIQTNTEKLSAALQEVVERLDNKISAQINDTLQQIYDIQMKQLECQNLSRQVTEELHNHLKNILTDIQEAHKNTERFLDKSTNYNFRQNETLSTQMGQFGDFVKTTGEQFQTQLSRMEEKYERELSEMEKFTKTLLLIIKKLSQDHENLYKQDEQQNN